MFLRNSKQLSKMSKIFGIEIDKDDIKKIGRTKLLDLTVDESLSWNQEYEVVKRQLKGNSIPSETLEK